MPSPPTETHHNAPVRAPRDPVAAGVYLTDGVFLFRVVRCIGSGAAEIAELEDCYGLDVVCVPMADLRERRLRVVAPAVAFERAPPPATAAGTLELRPGSGRQRPDAESSGR